MNPSAWQAFLLVLALFVAEVLASVLLVGLRRTLSLSRSELDVFATLLGNAMVFTYLVQKRGDAVSRHHPARVPAPVFARQGDLRVRLPARPAQRLAIRAHARVTLRRAVPAAARS
jgi:hypothetical protein